jgi:hypothetical protein
MNTKKKRKRKKKKEMSGKETEYNVEEREN